jgi:KaiC/GvpD/RAD55 family RecA-like ATPase
LYLRIPLGVERVDSLLQGGIPAGKTSVFYGPPGSGKTLLALAAAKTFTARGGVAYYLDTELKTSPDHVAPAVYVEVADVGHLLDTLLDILKKVRRISPLLVIIDSLSAVMHSLVLNHPDYAREKMRSLAQFTRQLNDGMVTVLAISWNLGGYHGKYLNPSLVLRTSKHHQGFRIVVEYGEDMLTPVEETVPIGEVLNVALT